MRVIVDRHRHVGLLVKQGSKWVHILVATPHGLEAQKISEDELTTDWSEVVNYDMAKAVASYRNVARKPRTTLAAVSLLAEAEQELKGEQHENYQATAG